VEECRSTVSTILDRTAGRDASVMADPATIPSVL